MINPPLLNIKSVATSLSYLPIDFVNYLGTSQAETDMLLRKMNDDQPNVVINTDAADIIKTTFPDISRWLSELANKNIHYVFVSQDFYISQEEEKTTECIKLPNSITT